MVDCSSSAQVFSTLKGRGMGAQHIDIVHQVDSIQLNRNLNMHT